MSARAQFRWKEGALNIITVIDCKRVRRLHLIFLLFALRVVRNIIGYRIIQLNDGKRDDIVHKTGKTRTYSP